MLRSSKESNSSTMWTSTSTNEVPPAFQQTFVLLTSPRSGSEWIMNSLNAHPSICSFPISDRIGFPTEALIPGKEFQDNEQMQGNKNINLGCYYAFVEYGINAIVQNATLSSACAFPESARGLEEPWATHIGRLCNIYHALDMNYSDSNIFAHWTDAFANEKTSLLGCTCEASTRVKGLKVMTGWIYDKTKGMYSEHSKLLDELFTRNVKVIRFKRKNLLNRVTSMWIAEKSGVWHMRGNTSNSSDPQAPENVPKVGINVEKLIGELKYMDSCDKHADKKFAEWGDKVLWLTYEDCKRNPEQCFNEMGRFLGVSKFQWFGSGRDFLEVTVKKTGLDRIENKGEVERALIDTGFAEFLDSDSLTPTNRSRLATPNAKCGLSCLDFNRNVVSPNFIGVFQLFCTVSFLIFRFKQNRKESHKSV